MDELASGGQHRRGVRSPDGLVDPNAHLAGDLEHEPV